MAIGEARLPPLHPVNGFRLGTTSAGIKTEGRQDLVVMEICAGASIAGVFTRNAFCAAPVQVAKANLPLACDADSCRYMVTNTGNANAGTGEQGMKDALETCEVLARQFEVDATSVLPFSTGVIGEHLPMSRLLGAFPAAGGALDESGWVEAAKGIMTTDTRPKGASRQFAIGGEKITLTGIAKGAGMIRPNMATMLGYVATDATINNRLLQEMLDEAVSCSFNRISVDGDTSTNDCCMLVATGKTGMAIEENSAEADIFQSNLTELLIELAQGLVKDGEGVTKFVTVKVMEGRTTAESEQVAFTVAESPLVKTAIFASDPNWGRILAAIGRAGVEDLDVSRVKLAINGVLIAENGGRAASYTEEAGQAVMAGDNLEILISLDRGDQVVSVWTTDLSYEYVRINADYRT